MVDKLLLCFVIQIFLLLFVLYLFVHCVYAMYISGLKNYILTYLINNAIYLIYVKYILLKMLITVSKID